MPCYNQAEFLAEALEAVLVQTHKKWECIIINDGSKDNTEEIATKYCAEDKRIKYISQENKGVSAARNNAITSANGTFILPLDADDKLSENYLEVCLKCSISEKDVLVSYGNLIEFGGRNAEVKLPDFNFELLLQRNLIFCTALFRKSDWKRVGGYDENMKDGLEDWEFWINLLKDGGKVIRTAECTFYYRIKEVSRNVEAIYNKEININLKEYIFNKYVKFYTNNYDFFMKNKELQHKIEYPEEYNTIYYLFKKFFKKIKINIKSKVN